MNFKLFVNEQQRDGFKLTFDAKDKEELKLCQELASKVIEKITKIEVKVTQEE